MKKILLVVVLIFCGLLESHGQNNIHYGVKVGGNKSVIVGDYLGNEMQKIGYQFGVFVEIESTDRFFYQIELLYANRGFLDWVELITENHYSVNAIWYFATELNYIEVPVLVKYNLLGGLHVGLGPQVGYLISARSDGYLNKGHIDVKDLYRKIDTGVNLRLEYDFNFGLILSSSYYRGLINIFDGGELSEGVKNSSLQFSLGYKF